MLLPLVYQVLCVICESVEICFSKFWLPWIDTYVGDMSTKGHPQLSIRARISMLHISLSI